MLEELNSTLKELNEKLETDHKKRMVKLDKEIVYLKKVLNGDTVARKKFTDELLTNMFTKDVS